VCLAVQLISATFVARDVESPNAATRIARTLAAGGGYAIAPPAGSSDPGALSRQPRRAHQLPGEPLLLAAALRLLPVWTERYLHVPVTVALVLAIAVVGWAAGGPRVGLAAGLIASLDPFVAAHGPVWDDLFLAAAAEWTLFALMVLRFRRQSGGPLPHFTKLVAGGKASVTVVACLAALAALTRTQSQVLIGVVGLVAVFLPRARPVRALGVAMVLGVILGVTAWGARNYVVLGEPLIGTTHDGKTLFESTYATARATILEHGVAQNFDWADAPPTLAGVEAVDELEADRRFARAAWQYMRTHPVDVAITAAFKIAISFSGLDLGRPVASPRNLVALITHTLLLAAGAWGLWQWRRRPSSEAAWVMTLAAIAFVVTLAFLAVGPVGLRYRIGFAGFLYIGVAAWWSARRGAARPAANVS
jgi:hypothetical protein